MRIVFFEVLLVTTFLTCLADAPDSTTKKFNATGTLSFNSNGINPIPAFTLGKPAIQALLNLSNGHFSYEPGLAYGLDARPWYIDNWFHYYIINKPLFKLRTGVNFSMFFSEKSLTDEKVLQGQRYWTGEIAGILTFKPGSNLTFMYWTDNGQDHGTFTGHFFCFSAEKSGIMLGELFRLSTLLQVFYINYDANNEGLFFTPRISLSEKHISFVLFFQATQPVTTKITPYPGFQWDIGISYAF